MSKPLPSPDGTPISYYEKKTKPASIPENEPLAPPKKPTPPTPPKQPSTKPYPRRDQPVRVLTIIDIYGWAYDEGRRGLYKELAKRHPDGTLAVASAKQETDGKVKPSNYNVV